MWQGLFSVNYLDKASRLGCASLRPGWSQAALTVAVAGAGDEPKGAGSGTIISTGR